MDTNNDVIVLKTENRENEECKYFYRLSIIEQQNLTSANLYEIYITLSSNNSEIVQTSHSEIVHFSTDETANDFFEMLVKNLVTPLDLPYVIADEIYHK